MVVVVDEADIGCGLWDGDRNVEMVVGIAGDGVVGV